MHHDAGIGEGAAFAGGAGSEKKRPHGGCLTDAKGGDRRPNVLDRIVDSKTGSDDAAGGVDVEVNGFRGVLGFEKKKLRDHDGGGVVRDGAVDAYDPLLEETGEDVVGAFAARSLLDHHRDQAVGTGEYTTGCGGGRREARDGAECGCLAPGEAETPHLGRV